MTAMTFDYNTAVISDLFKMAVSLPMKAANAVYSFYVRRKAERELMGLDARMLQDIGITRGEIHARVWGK